MYESLLLVAIFIGCVIVIGALSLIVKCLRKVEQGSALVRNGWGGSKVSFGSLVVVPVLHRFEVMDISVKRIEIFRHGSEGLICRDNIRADIKVVFFVRVNNTQQDVLKVAQSLGCKRGSDHKALEDLFDAKFSEGLKTVGKQFDFVELYNSRDRFKDEIIKIIGTDLNGYVLEDAAIDYLEQTPLEKLNPSNILDAEGIKKITELTAQQLVLANSIAREREKTIKKQDVEAREAVLVLERQEIEATEKQKREVAALTAREEAEAAKIGQEERLRAERARIAVEEEIGVAAENKERQIVVARRNRERTDAVEAERVEKDRMLEATERERVVQLAEIERESALEAQRRKMQDVIRERVQVEREVVQEQERIKDTQDFAAAERAKKVALLAAETEAQRQLVAQVKAAEAARDSARFEAEQKSIEAEAMRAAGEKEAEARRILAEAVANEAAAAGLGEARVIEARAAAEEKAGTARATVLEREATAKARGVEAMAAASQKTGASEAATLEAKGIAEAKGIEARAVAVEREGLAQAKVLQEKGLAEAKGITEKAAAMKLLDTVGKEHEEFKLRLDAERQLRLAAIDAQKDVAREQAEVLAAAMKSARIDIVGGEVTFFERMLSSIGAAKSIDRLVETSVTLRDFKASFIGDAGEAGFQEKLREFVGRFGLKSEDVKNLSIAALLARLQTMADTPDARTGLQGMLALAERLGLADKKVGTLDVVAEPRASESRATDARGESPKAPARPSALP